MFGLVLSAVLARRAQAVWLLVLTVLAVGAATAAPWYLASAVDSVATADIAAASAGQRVYVVNGTVRTAGQSASPLPAAKAKIDTMLGLTGLTVTMGGQVYGSLQHGKAT